MVLEVTMRDGNWPPSSEIVDETVLEVTMRDGNGWKRHSFGGRRRCFSF